MDWVPRLGAIRRPRMGFFAVDFIPFRRWQMRRKSGAVSVTDVCPQGKAVHDLFDKKWSAG